jgi:hypothetical protein
MSKTIMHRPVSNCSQSKKSKQKHWYKNEIEQILFKGGGGDICATDGVKEVPSTSFMDSSKSTKNVTKVAITSLLLRLNTGYCGFMKK